MAIPSDFLEQVKSEEDDKVAAAVESFYRLDYSSRRAQPLLWEELLRFLEGEQWLRPPHHRLSADVSSTVPLLSRVNPISQPRTNYCYFVVRTLTSMLVKNAPRGTFRSKGTDTSHVLARSAEKLIEVLDEMNEERMERMAWALWAVTLGTGIKKNFIEEVVPYGPGSFIAPEGGSPFEDENGEPVSRAPTVLETKLSSCVLSPFEMSVNSTATSPLDLEYVMETSVRSLDWIRTAFDKDAPGYTGRADEVEAEQDLESPLNIWHRLQHLGPTWHDYGRSEADLSASAVVKEVYIRPSNDFPRGRMAIVANGVPLFVDDTPYLKAGIWHPYVFFRYFVFPGRFWGVGALEHTIPLQRRINAIDAFVALYRATMLAPKLLLAKGHQMNVDQITGVPGQILEYAGNQQHPPQIIQAPALPQTVWQERDRAVQELKEITGTTDPLSGDRAVGAPSYSVQALLYERGSEAHAITHGNWEQAIECDVESRMLMAVWLLKKDDPKLTRLVTEKLKMGGAEIENFKLSDLQDSVEVRIEGGSSVPRSRVLQQQAIMDLAGNGMIDLSDPKVRFDFLELFAAEQFERTGFNVEKAQLENSLFMKGAENAEKAFTMFLPFEDHGAHANEHLRCLVENYDSLEEQDRNLLWGHVQEHQKALMQAQQQQPGQPPAEGATPPQGGQQAPGLTGGPQAGVQ